MDSNRIPSSSPLQHHNESCGHARPSSSSSSDPAPPVTSSAIPRPSSSNQHPLQSPTTTKAPLSWPQESTGASSSAPRPWGASGAVWPSEDELSGSGSQPVASSSRLPSTHFSFDPSTADEESLESSSLLPNQSPFLDPPGSALLTSEPLNRSSSTLPSPPFFGPSTSTAPSPLAIPMSVPLSNASISSSSSSGSNTGKRRARASSLPSADPIFKRRRFAEIPTPSEQWARTFAVRRKDPSTLAVQQARARGLGEHYLAGRPLRGGCRPGHQVVVASRQTPINLKTLRSLDAHEILKQPQLRHDLLFDTLAFRPIHSGSSHSDTLGNTAHARKTSSGAVVPPTTACSVSDMYWESIEMELLTGCRCTRWEVPLGSRLEVSALKGKERMAECICGRWRADLNEDDWWQFQRSRMWPTRLPELVRTLREILISLMGSTTPCPNHFAHSFSREALDAHELTCPTVTHALVPQLYEALDPEFLTRRVRRNAFDLSLFEMLGEAMKVHCAPIRDVLVDDMVRTATTAGVTLGLRKCFDCVEIMKLDIATHQVHALRPYLWSCAPQYELSAFHNHLSATSTLLSASSTRTWVREASVRVLARTAPQVRLHVLGHCQCKAGDSTELIIRSAADGFVDLVFGTEKSKAGAVDIASAVPESLRMDIRRIKAFHDEAGQITTNHLIILACRNLLVSVHPELSLKDTTKHLQSISSQLDFLLSTHPLWTSYPTSTTATANPEIALQLAAHILRLDQSTTSIPYTPEEHLRLSNTADTLLEYISTQARSDSALFMQVYKRLEEVVRLILTNELLKLEGELNVSGKVGDYEQCVAGGSAEIDGGNPKGEENVPEQAGKAKMGDVRLGGLPIIREHDRNLTSESTSSASSSFPLASQSSSMTTARSRLMRDKQRAEEKRLMRLYGLDTASNEVRAFVKRLERIAGFNVGVFRGVYGEQGMMVGA